MKCGHRIFASQIEPSIGVVVRQPHLRQIHYEMVRDKINFLKIALTFLNNLDVKEMLHSQRI